MKIELYEEVCNNNKIIYNVNFLNTNIDYLEEKIGRAHV